MNTFWEITAVIMVISLSLYLRNWIIVSHSINRREISTKVPKIINIPSDQSMPPILHQTAGVVFFIISCVAFAINPSSLIVRTIGIFCMNATTFLPFYVHHRLFRKDQNSYYTIIVLVLTTIITIVTTTLDYLRNENSFLDGFKQRGDEVYYAYYFTGIAIPLTLNTMTTILFYQNIYQYRDGLSIVRRTIGFIAFLSAAISDIILLINLFLSFWSNAILWLDTVFSILLPLLALLLTLYVLPRKYYQKITQHIDARLRQEEQEAREYLHDRCIRAEPVASGYDVGNLDPKIMDTEIDQARYIAWTHKPTNRLITPEMDAHLLFELLSKGSSLYKIGPAEPRSPRDDDVNKHNVAVMHILKRKESLISSQSSLIGHHNNGGIMSIHGNKRASLLSASYLARGLVSSFFGAIAVSKARTHLLWHLSIGASEWGHIATLLSLTSLLPGWRKSRAGRISGLLSFASAIVTLTPLIRAILVARKIPHQIESFQSTTLSLSDVSPRAAPLVIRDLLLGVSSPDVRRYSLVYTTSDNIELPLDIYQPLHNKTNNPCVIMIHGGSWNKGNSKQLWPLNHYLAARGYTVAAINYRLAPKHKFPAALDDVFAAIQYLKANANSLGIDPHRIVLAGRSAGGHLALLSSYYSRDPDIKGVISFYGFADLEYCHRHPAPYSRTFNTRLVIEQFLGGTPDEIPDVYRQASPISFVDKDSPPTLLIYGDRDAFISTVDAQRLSQRLTQLEIPSFLLRLPWGHHGGDFNFSGPFGQISTYTIERFLASVCALSRQPLAE